MSASRGSVIMPFSRRGMCMSHGRAEVIQPVDFAAMMAAPSGPRQSSSDRTSQLVFKSIVVIYYQFSFLHHTPCFQLYQCF